MLAHSLLPQNTLSLRCTQWKCLKWADVIKQKQNGPRDNSSQTVCALWLGCIAFGFELGPQSWPLRLVILAAVGVTGTNGMAEHILYHTRPYSIVFHGFMQLLSSYVSLPTTSMDLLRFHLMVFKHLQDELSVSAYSRGFTNRKSRTLELFGLNKYYLRFFFHKFNAQFPSLNDHWSMFIKTVRRHRHIDIAGPRSDYRWSVQDLEAHKMPPISLYIIEVLYRSVVFVNTTTGTHLIGCRGLHSPKLNRRRLCQRWKHRRRWVVKRIARS